MDCVHIKNLEKYHPGYKDRKLHWCKTYFSMLNSDPEFMLLDEIDKWRFTAFVMLELQIKRPVPLYEKFLEMKGFDLKRRPISMTLHLIQNFVDIVTEPLRNSTEAISLACPRVEKSREEKSREDRNVRVSVTGLFKKPTVDEIGQFLKENNLSLDKDKFFNYYEANGWRVGKNPMKDWRAACRNWAKSDFNTVRVNDGIPDEWRTKK